jgi:hypothetical protein
MLYVDKPPHDPRHGSQKIASKSLAGVLTTRVIRISSIVALVKTIGFYLASSHIFGLVRQSASQGKYQQ